MRTRPRPIRNLTGLCGLIFVFAASASACASNATTPASGPVIFADQLQATAEAAAHEAGAAQPDPVELASPTTSGPTQVPAKTPDEPPAPATTITTTPATEPSTPTPREPAPTSAPPTPVFLPCANAETILAGWLESPIDVIVREAERFPKELWVCEDLGVVNSTLVCLPEKTERMYLMYADFYGNEFNDLLTSGTVFCIAGDPELLDPAIGPASP